ncbi:hypothetical protein ACET3Z_033103 [Daucus carota]
MFPQAFPLQTKVMIYLRLSSLPGIVVFLIVNQYLVVACLIAIILLQVSQYADASKYCTMKRSSLTWFNLSSPAYNHDSVGDFVDSTPTARKLNFVVLCILLSSTSDSRKKRSSKTFTLLASRNDPSKEEASDRDQQLLRSVLEMGAAFAKASGKEGYVLGKALAVGTSSKVQKVDQNYQVSQQVNSAVAKSAVFSNEYVSRRASWVTVTCDSIAKAAAEVSQHAKEKVALAEEEQRR